MMKDGVSFLPGSFLFVLFDYTFGSAWYLFTTFCAANGQFLFGSAGF